MPSLVHVDPFRDLMTLRSAMDRLFDETLGQPGAVYAGIVGPAIDLFQTEDEVVVKASLPGVDPKDLNISVTGDVLTLRGEVREERDVQGTQYHVKERRYGNFARSITLPTAVVADRADAQFEHGILTLKLPKAEEVKPKTITVRAK